MITYRPQATVGGPVRPRQFDEDELLRIAFSQFWQGGVRGTTLSDIARASGVQRGSLYNAYGSKEALFLRAYSRYAETYVATVEASLTASRSLRDRLSAFFAAAIHNFTEGSGGLGCPTTRGLMELTNASEGTDDEARQAFATLLSRVSELLERVFEEARETGEYAGDPAAAADHVLSITRGMVIIDSAFHDRRRLENIAAFTVDLMCPRVSSH